MHRDRHVERFGLGPDRIELRFVEELLAGTAVDQHGDGTEFLDAAQFRDREFGIAHRNRGGEF